MGIYVCGVYGNIDPETVVMGGRPSGYMHAGDEVLRRLSWEGRHGDICTRRLCMSKS